MPTHVCVGVSAAERQNPQELLVTVRLTILNPPRFQDHDDLVSTLDYDALIGFVRTTLPARGPFVLIETVADVVASAALELSPRVAEVAVTVAKPTVLKGAGLISVGLTRHASTARLTLGLRATEAAHP